MSPRCGAFTTFLVRPGISTSKSLFQITASFTFVCVVSPKASCFRRLIDTFCGQLSVVLSLELHPVVTGHVGLLSLSPRLIQPAADNQSVSTSENTVRIVSGHEMQRAVQPVKAGHHQRPKQRLSQFPDNLPFLKQITASL